MSARFWIRMDITLIRLPIKKPNPDPTVKKKRGSGTDLLYLPSIMNLLIL